VILRDTTSSDENHNYIPDDLSNYKVVRAGQFVMNKMKAWQGSYGVSRHDGIVSPAYFVLDVFGLRSDFFHVAIRSRAYVPAFTRASDGVRVGQWDLAEARMRDVQFLVPPAFEQAAIVRFLDHADRRIRRYIRTKQKLIALLNEQKQAIIHEAVTGQIDVRTGRPYPDYKDSGVEWLGAVPAHWDVQRSKRVFRPRTELAHPGDTQLSAYSVSGVALLSDRETTILYLYNSSQYGITRVCPTSALGMAVRNGSHARRSGAESERGARATARACDTRTNGCNAATTACGVRTTA